MDAFEMALLFDYYGAMLTEKQRDCLDMRFNQDMSLSEIGNLMGVSRQAVYDNLTRTEAQLLRLEENIGCVKRDRAVRDVLAEIMALATRLRMHPDAAVAQAAGQILSAAARLEE